MDTEEEKAIVDKLKTGEVFKFIKCSDGLYFYNTSSLKHNTKTKNKINDYIAI